MLSDEELREESAWQWAKPLVERIKEYLKECGYALERVKEKPHCLLCVRQGIISRYSSIYSLGNFHDMLTALFCCLVPILQDHGIEIDAPPAPKVSHQREIQIKWRLRFPNSDCFRISLEFRADLQCPCPYTITAKLRIKDLTLGILNLDEQYPLTEIPQIIVNLPRLWALSRL